MPSPASVGFKRLCLFLCLLLLPSASHAWNGAGHRQIAALAWEEMSAENRQKVAALLRQHPDYPRWRQRQQKNDPKGDPDYGVFLEASTWADEIRGDTRFYGAKDAPTPRLNGFPDMRRHSDWHYRDAGGGNIDSALKKLASDLAHGNRAAKIYALPWLIHLVGDIHQPLHCGGKNDRGGNQTTIINPARSKRPEMSLHKYWDDLPGPHWQRGKYLSDALNKLRRLPPPSQAEPVGDVNRWYSESRELLAKQVYPPRKKISAAFQKHAETVAAQRVSAAGRRLGRWLNRLL
ncbi:MAG: S1/P1 nuclease [Zoogloeaceae bacterium]|nr:S1/P1 nuclease [Zoogloeaceae bacterium]